jgi:hypothetical protein
MNTAVIGHSETEITHFGDLCRSGGDWGPTQTIAVFNHSPLNFP